MINLISEICKKYTGMGYQYLNNISDKKKNTAIINYKIPNNEQMIALIDGTLLGNAKNGVAICTTGLYWSNPWMSKTNVTYISWEDYAKSDLKLKDSEISVGDGAVISTIGYFDDKQMISLFKEIQVGVKKCISNAILENERNDNFYKNTINNTYANNNIYNTTNNTYNEMTPPPFPEEFKKNFR